MKKERKKKVAHISGWYIIIHNDSPRVYAHHVDVSVVLQAYASLTKYTKSKCDIVYARSAESAIERAKRTPLL